MSEMKNASSVCHSLAKANLPKLPRDFVFREGYPTYEAIQEIFWSCMVEVVDELLEGPPLPGEIRIGKQHIPITVTPEQWHQLASELELDDKLARKIAWEVLSNQLLLREGLRGVRQDMEGTLAERFSSKLLGLVLLTCYLDTICRSGPPKSFVYEFRELTHLARGELAWARVGSFEEGRIARDFFTHAAMRIQRSDRLLWIPYHAYYRPLSGRLVGRTPHCLTLGTSRPSLPTDYLLRALPEKEQGDVQESHQPSGIMQTEKDLSLTVRELRDELKRLMAENDRLRLLSVTKFLVQLLAPVLSTVDQPLAAIEQAMDGDSVLAQDILHAVARLLLGSPEIELFGDPTQEVELMLPNPDYCLDEAVPPALRDISRGRFRVNRRGIRLRGMLLAPATVVPIQR